jgi:sugar O-acyltransferase (sialic acid O-acetyltransferase NeuD family)
MADAIPVTIPLVNPNEPEARLASLSVQNGQQVQVGDPLAVVETTKAAHELVAEASGFIVGVRSATGDPLRAGDVLCWIAAMPEWKPTAAAPAIEAPVAGRRITQPARRAAEQAGLDLAELPADRLITEEMVRAHIAATQSNALPSGPFGESDLVVYGGGGHGKSLIELIRTIGAHHIVGILDDGLPAGAEVLGVPVLGGRSILPELRRRGLGLAANAVGGIGDVRSRLQVSEALQHAGFECPPLIHPTAWLEATVQVAPGAQILPFAYVGSEAIIGRGAIVNTSAVVSHDCRLGEYANVAPGALLAGGVEVGEAALIGMGVTVHLGVRVGRYARCGNSAVITADVPEGALVRAGSLWPERKAE